MNINEFIEEYNQMILRPIAVNQKFGFELVNGMRWYFEDPSLTNQSKKTLKKIYQQLKNINN